MKKLVLLLSCLFLSQILINCGSNKKVKDTKSKISEYEVLQITKKEILSNDGTKIIKVPVISLKSYGVEVDSRKLSEKSAIENATSRFSNLIKKKFNDAFDENSSSLNKSSKDVLRSVIKTSTNNIISNLIPGKIITEQKPNGNYLSLAEVKISGKEFKGILTNSKSNLSYEEIEKTKDFFKAVDDILDK